MFGLTLEKLFFVAVIAGLVFGPSRLPGYAHHLTRAIRTLKQFVETTRATAEREMGVPLHRSEWESLDLRQYDPRRIIREALLDDAPVPTVRAASAAAAVTSASALTKPRSATMPFTAEDPPPFDSEAT